MVEHAKRHAAGEASDPWPKHHRVYLVLRQEILEGRYTPDKPLPNELLLTEQFQVSRITIRKAMERLDREGLVVRYRGKGTFPVASNESSPVQASISGVIENLIAMGLKTEVRVLDFNYVAASANVSQALAIPPGALVQKAIRVRSHRDSPFSLLTTYVPEAIGRTFNQGDLTHQPLLLLLERAGAKVTRAEQSITAKLATPKQAEVLEMEPGDALLCIRRIVFDENDLPVEYIEGYYRPDTYEHQMSLGRQMHDDRCVWETR
ncbi:GntR family transcriptional regulator [Halomonas cupida]|uniref:GntR family transcriptional regulator n=1 Tax=Halomonas cupida TaxID=44933 RepID=A0A1M7CQN4_9GAMM|nr:GntR family transcriptional regulator [Halomonas cupida]GEN26063.1 GntR family transcriptional regulator [Halomonas cupida]SHL69517.1 GntR family transcriptional regulator [Halomonas cupida]